MADQGKDATERVKQTADRIWRAGLGALASAEKNGTELFDKLTVAGERFEKEYLRPAGEVAERELRSAGQQAERFVGREWDRFLSSLGVSTDKEVNDLRDEVAQLKKELKAAKRGAATPARKKTSANTTSAAKKK